jgi:hypothetical protein
MHYQPNHIEIEKHEGGPHNKETTHSSNEI